MHGEPALPADFDHLPYANPDAPKGGRITYGFVGTFDSLNPFIVKGTSPRGLWDETLGRNVWESLLTRNRDEPFSLYGLLAESVESPADRSWVEFTLRPEAKFADGEPVTPEDVIFTVELLKEKGRPPTRPMLANSVAKVEKTGERSVRFTFKDATNRELPLLIGLMVILPKHAIDPATFDQTLAHRAARLRPLRRVARSTPGEACTLKRRDDYWGKDLPIKRGFDNFDEIKVEYYRNAESYFEAFKKGLFDAIRETDPTRWATQYNFPALADGRVVKESFPTKTPKAMTGFVFNTERPVFSDPRVREALTYCLDFEWLNRSLYYGLYQRTGSYFQDSELSALGRPASDAEKALLATFPDAVRPEVMDGTYAPPVSDGSGTDRASAAQGLRDPEGGRLRAEGRCAGQHRDRRAARLRGAGARGGGREPGARHAAHLRPARREDRRPTGRVAAIRGADQGLRLRHDPLRLSRRRSRPATSRTIAGPLPRRTTRARSTSPASARPGGRRDDRGAACRRRSATTSSLRCAPSTAC